MLDDWGLEKLDLGQRNDMLELMEDRHGSKSTMITSQLPVKDWQAGIGDATLADAIPDRLVQNSHRIALKGKSKRSMDKIADRIKSTWLIASDDILNARALALRADHHGP